MKMIFVTVLFIYTQLIWIKTTSGHILRLPCLEYGNFSIIKTGFKLNGHVLTTLHFVGEDECEQECIYHRLCKSVSFNIDVCELNSKSTEDPFDSARLSNAAGWTYKSTDYKEKNIGYYCQEIKPCKFGLQCTDSCTFPGYECDTFQSCQEAHNKGMRETTIVPIILVPAQLPQLSHGPNTLHVRCDMETDGGGWTVFQRRIDASVDFNRGWTDYKTGFGDLNGNFWLGLDNLHRLASPGKGAKLRIDLKHQTQQENFYAVYNTFEISGEADGYRLKVGAFSGNAGDGMSYHDGMKFSTKDQDNDMTSMNCAEYFEGGWWYNWCFLSHLNGRHPNTTEEHFILKHISWNIDQFGFGEWTITEMKLK